MTFYIYRISPKCVYDAKRFTKSNLLRITIPGRHQELGVRLMIVLLVIAFDIKLHLGTSYILRSVIFS